MPPFIAALGHEAISAPWVMDGAMDGNMFKARVDQFLYPALRPGDLLIADNLSCHKVAGVKEAIEAVGATLLYRPPIPPISIPLRKCSRNSRRSRATSLPVQKIHSGKTSALSSTPSHQKNAKIISLPVDM
jgi:hypothetical protein